jgi:hypothetical protein
MCCKVKVSPKRIRMYPVVEDRRRSTWVWKELSTVRVVAGWLYGLQVFLVVPWFLGAMYRGEQSLWFWRAYARDAIQHGRGDAAFLVYLYAVFYSALVLLPYFALRLRYPVEAPGTTKYFREGRILLSTWAAGTFLLFARPLSAFIHALPTAIWHGWLLIFWAASAVAVVTLILTLEKRIGAMPR